MKNDPASVFTRLLLPIKELEPFRNTLPLIELFSEKMAGDLEGIDLLHVVGGSFLSTHLNNIDFRAGHVLSSDLMQRLRQRHHEELIKPMLSEVEELLQKSAVSLPVKIRVEDGEPVNKISSICKDEKYSTLILARSKREESSGAGTVINGILQVFLDAGVYIVGEEGFPSGKSPAARVVIGVDGSETGLRAVREAALLLSRAHDVVEEVSLVNVRDPSCFFDDSKTSCRKASEQGYGYIREAEELLIKTGVDESKIVPTLLFGRPGETLTAHAESFKATLCFIGRRDRSKIAEVLLGSVSGDIVHRCRKTTIALIG
ncbi:MAG: universal stress protein [Desulforhopalus sp.]